MLRKCVRYLCIYTAHMTLALQHFEHDKIIIIWIGYNMQWNKALFCDKWWYYKSISMQENSSCTKVQQLLLTQQRSVSMVTLQIKSQLMNKMSTKHDFFAHWQFVSIFYTVAYILPALWYVFLNLLLTNLQTSAYKRGSYWSDSNWPNISKNFLLKYMNDN